MDTISIKDLIQKDEQKVWIKYVDEFEIQIKYLSRSDLNRLFESSRETIWSKQDHTKTERLNSDVFYKKFIEKVLVDWKGLKAKTLAKMLPIKVDDPELEIPFTAENAFELLRNAYDFDVFVQQQVMDLTQFQTDKIEAEKKI